MIAAIGAIRAIGIRARLRFAILRFAILRFARIGIAAARLLALLLARLLDRSAIGRRLGQIGIERQSTVIGGDRLIETLQLRQGIAPVVMADGIVAAGPGQGGAR